MERKGAEAGMMKTSPVWHAKDFGSFVYGQWGAIQGVRRHHICVSGKSIRQGGWLRSSCKCSEEMTQTTTGTVEGGCLEGRSSW